MYNMLSSFYFNLRCNIIYLHNTQQEKLNFLRDNFSKHLYKLIIVG